MRYEVGVGLLVVAAFNKLPIEFDGHSGFWALAKQIFAMLPRNRGHPARKPNCRKYIAVPSTNYIAIPTSNPNSASVFGDRSAHSPKTKTAGSFDPAIQNSHPLTQLKARLLSSPSSRAPASSQTPPAAPSSRSRASIPARGATDHPPSP
jgi:hypothetical protein